MDYKRIDTGGITYFAALEGSDWRWGMDYTDGDLYEAEELFRDGHRISRNRLLFLHFPEGRLAEPVKAEEGQYLGRPAASGGRIYCLTVDFKEKTIVISRCFKEMDGAEEIVRLPLDVVPDCYNLMLHTEPLTLTRQGHENTFQIVWPERGGFEISPRESLDSREGDRLIFSEWFEDPDYREETVIRSVPDGTITERLPGSWLTAPDGTHWLIG